MKGFTLIDILVGTALIALVFTGIFGAYQLGAKVLQQSQKRVVATAIANEYLERARNLDYSDVGVQGGFPDGVFAAQETIQRNGDDYTVNVDIDYVADEADGLSSPEDNCINDYKRVRASIAWSKRISGEMSLASDVMPKNSVEECAQSGGLLQVQVMDAGGSPAAGADVAVEDVNTALTDSCLTDTDGGCQLLLPASSPETENYKITVQKSGYSSTETFAAGDIYNSKTITTPALPHSTVYDGEITQRSFSIDELGSFSISTRSSRGPKAFADEFNDLSKIQEFNNVTATSSGIEIVQSGGVYVSPGYFISQTIEDSELKSWDELRFNLSAPAESTTTVQVLYFDATSSAWVAIPEEDLLGNTSGFISSPVDLSSLDIAVYDKLRLRGDLSTADDLITPSLDNWQLSYFTRNDFSLGNILFHLRGEKIVGTDIEENPIYTYEQSHTTAGDGTLSLQGMEWDNYTFRVEESETGFSLEEISPAPQPVALDPGVPQPVTLYLKSQHSLLVTVLDSGTGEPIFSANTLLTAPDYSESKLTNENGQVFYAPLEAQTYSLEVTAAGYDPYSASTTVSGETTETVNLNLNPE